jgi:hypothetical protein
MSATFRILNYHQTCKWRMQVVGDGELPDMRGNVAVVIAEAIDRKTGIGIWSMETIAKKAAMSKSGVEKIVNAMVERGHLGIVKGRGQGITNKYWPILKAGAVDEPTKVKSTGLTPEIGDDEIPLYGPDEPKPTRKTVMDYARDVLSGYGKTGIGITEVLLNKFGPEKTMSHLVNASEKQNPHGYLNAIIRGEKNPDSFGRLGSAIV